MNYEAFTPRDQWTEEDQNRAKLAAADASGKLPNGRKRLCGAWTLRGLKPHRALNPGVGRSALGGREQKYSRLRCKSWSCSQCGPRKVKQYRAQIVKAVDRSKLTRLFTLTLDPRNIASPDEVETFYAHYEENRVAQKSCACPVCTRVQRRAIPHIRKCWAKLRVYLHRKFGQAPKYVAVLEFQKTTGLAHLHIVIDRYIEQAWARNVWSSIGGGEHVDIRWIDAHRAGAYLSKYLSKELLLSAPDGVRRVTTSRSIKLLEKKPSEYEWQLLKKNIEQFFVVFEKSVSEISRDSEGELDAFVVRE